MSVVFSRRTVLGGLTAAGLSNATSVPWSSQAEAAVAIRWGEVPSTVSFPLIIARQQGYCAKHNIDLRQANYAGFDALHSALRADGVDMGPGGIASIVDSRAKGSPLLIVFGTNLL